MSNQTVAQAVIVTGQVASGTATPIQLALFKEDGTRKSIADQAAAQANSTAATVGDLVTDFNALLAKLRTAGVIAT